MIIYDYRVGDFMTKRVRAVTEKMSISKIARIMSRFKIGSVVVMRNKTPSGIITDTDIVRKVVAKNRNADKIRASDIMTKSVITVSPNTSLRDSAYIMANHKVKRLPVIDKERGLVGIVTETDVVRILSDLKNENNLY